MRPAGIVLLLVALAVLGCAGKLITKVHGEGPELRSQSESQQTATARTLSQRGHILDAKGRILAGSIRKPSLFIDPLACADPRYAAHSIAPLLGLDADVLLSRILDRPKARFLWIKHHLSDAEVDAVRRVRGERRLRSIGIQLEPVRSYPYGGLAAQVLGYVGSDQTGLAGLEYTFNRFLEGEGGKRASTVTRKRQRVRPLPDAHIAPRNGATIVLTLDAYLQERVERHLANAVEEFGAVWGTAVLMDPQSGEVLAMATVPSFDPASPFAHGMNAEQHAAAAERIRNRAIADAYEPGSIFKPFIAGPAVDAGLASLTDQIDIHGPARQFGSRTIHDDHVFSSLPLWAVISKSSNIGMALLGERLGRKHLYEYVRRFGFGDRTGIQLPGEHRGLVHDLSSWTKFSVQSIPFGQEISTTALQMISAFSVFCNDGVLYRPRMVRGIIAEDGTVLEDRSRPVQVRRVLSAESARRFRLDALVPVVNDGTGTKAQLDDYQVFGKTGTAQLARTDGRGYLPGAYVGSFVAGAPARDPKLAVLVTIYHASGRSYYGGTVAAPTAREILAEALTYLHVPSDSSLATRNQERRLAGR